MFEKVNPSHPDKIADRIAGAIVDLAYREYIRPQIAVEVLIGHGHCHIIIEGDHVPHPAIEQAVWRITKDHDMNVDILEVPQDKALNENQEAGYRCGDNGIFKGMPETEEERKLTKAMKVFYLEYPSDGKGIINGTDEIYCLSNADLEGRRHKWLITQRYNPLGKWTGGTDVDTGATNRKLGSDMGGSITGGGLHGKDLSKADVSVNIYVWLKAQETGKPVELCCAIGDETVDGRPYEEIVEIAMEYIRKIGGFEKFAEWGLIR